jgi:isoquinoline 1-oxidoreductase beta subunit
VIDALSTTQLETTVAGGAMQQLNFDQYPILRIDKAPDVDCHFIQSDNSPTGLGEPPFEPVAPAIGNAIFAASGKRIRELPFTRAGISL